MGIEDHQPAHQQYEERQRIDPMPKPSDEAVALYQSACR
jgi:hypothetical protein